MLQHCLESRPCGASSRSGSAFVYRLPPGNANRLGEESELDLDPDVPPEIRSWIDCDMILHGEVHNDRLRVVLLRVPTVVAAGRLRLPAARARRPAGAALRRARLRPDLRAGLGQGRGASGAVGRPRAAARHLQHRRQRVGAALDAGALDRARAASPVPGPLMAWPDRGRAPARRARRSGSLTRRAALRLHARHAPRRARARLPAERPHRPRPRRRRRAARGNGRDLTDRGYPRRRIPGAPAAWPSTLRSSAMDSRSSSTASPTRSSTSST